MNLKIENLKAPFKLPTVMLRFLLPYRFDEVFLFTKVERGKMEEHLRRREESYLSAAGAFEKDGDESSATYGYYNLANELRSAFRFRKAKRYLRLAKQIAERLSDDRLLPRIKALEKSIRVKNRDTPNYMAGERRPPIG